MLRPADTVSFGEVLRIFEGPLAPLPCLSRQSYRRCEDCVSEAICEIRREFGRAYDASRQVLDSRTIGDALANSPYGGSAGEKRRLAG
jgi:DNA-binding IscR family transcriptional regulator